MVHFFSTHSWNTSRAAFDPECALQFKFILVVIHETHLLGGRESLEGFEDGIGLSIFYLHLQ